MNTMQSSTERLVAMLLEYVNADSNVIHLSALAPSDDEADETTLSDLITEAACELFH